MEKFLINPIFKEESIDLLSTGLLKTGAKYLEIFFGIDSARLAISSIIIGFKLLICEVSLLFIDGTLVDQQKVTNETNYSLVP